MNVIFTPAAAKFIQRMVAFHGGDRESGFRLSVKSGGCAGYSYDFRLQAAPAEDDAVVDAGGIRVFIPRECAALLDGVTVDFQESLAYTGLTFTNPNAVSACGCGSSFAVMDGRAPAPSGGRCRR